MAATEATGSGRVLDLIRHGVVTRQDLLDELGWSRVTLDRRLDELMQARIVERAGTEASRGGRPREAFRVIAGAGVLLAVDIGSSHTRLGITDLVSTVICEDEADIGLFDGPEMVFEWAEQVFAHHLARLDIDRSAVRGVGIGVPGPVHPATGRVGTMQLDPRWDDLDVADRVRDWCEDGVVVVDRDVNIVAVGEARLGWPDHRDLVVVKVGMGVGVAFVLDGAVHRGVRGSAGLISAPVRGRLGEPLHRLEEVASGATIRDTLSGAGQRLVTSADIVARAAEHPEVAAEIERIGSMVGYALADVVGLLNPSVVVIGGNLSRAGDLLLAPLRSMLFRTSHPLSRQGLAVEPARLGERAGILGASLMAQDALFDSTRVSEMTRQRDGVALSLSSTDM